MLRQINRYHGRLFRQKTDFTGVGFDTIESRPLMVMLMRQLCTIYNSVFNTNISIYLISLVQCNNCVTTNFLFFGKLSFKVWKTLCNHGVITKFKLDNSNFKATRVVRKILSLKSKGGNKHMFQIFGDTTILC